MSDTTPTSNRKMQVRTVELPTPDGVIRGKVAVTTGPLSLAGLVPTVYELTNALVGRAIGREQDAGRTLSCRAGCGACCRHMVPLSPPEAFYLMDVIESFEPVRRATVLERFDEIVGVLDARGMIDKLLEPPPCDEPVLPVAREYFGLGQACPLLVDESCSIHAHRPIACRDYNVTSPAAWCGRPYEHAISKVPMRLPLSVPLSKLTGIVTGEKACLIPLTLVPRWVSGRGDLRARRWPGLELFDRLLAQLAEGNSDADTPAAVG